MSRANTFAFRVSNNERQLIAELAERMQRSQSDAVRFVVLEAVRRGAINIISNKDAGQEKTISESFESINVIMNDLGKSFADNFNVSEQLQSLSNTLSTIRTDLKSGT